MGRTKAVKPIRPYRYRFSLAIEESAQWSDDGEYLYESAYDHPAVQELLHHPRGPNNEHMVPYDWIQHIDTNPWGEIDLITSLESDDLLCRLFLLLPSSVTVYEMFVCIHRA